MKVLTIPHEKLLVKFESGGPKGDSQILCWETEKKVILFVINYGDAINFLTKETYVKNSNDLLTGSLLTNTIFGFIENNITDSDEVVFDYQRLSELVGSTNKYAFGKIKQIASMFGKEMIYRATKTIHRNYLREAKIVLSTKDGHCESYEKDSVIQSFNCDLYDELRVEINLCNWDRPGVDFILFEKGDEIMTLDVKDEILGVYTFDLNEKQFGYSKIVLTVEEEK